MFPEYLEHIGEQCYARTEEDEASNIERMSALAVIGEMQIDEQQAGEADRDIHEEDEAPMQVSDDQSAGNRSQHGADQCRNSYKAHGANKFGLGKGPHQGQAADRHHHGSAAALQHAKGDQQMDVAGHATEKRTQREKADSGCENAAGSEAIGHPAADGNEDGEA